MPHLIGERSLGQLLFGYGVISWIVLAPIIRTRLFTQPALPVALLAVVTFGSTLSGGLFAFRHRGKLQRILGFTAGVLLGVVAFDLLPEVHELTLATGSDFTTAMITLAAGFLFLHVVKMLTVILSSRGDHVSSAGEHPQLGVVSALALSAHSFSDGVGIGLGFQVSTTVGLAVAGAVIAHDFADGLNTVALMLLNGNADRRTWRLLLLDAVTPILGAASNACPSRCPHRGPRVGVAGNICPVNGSGRCRPSAGA